MSVERTIWFDFSNPPHVNLFYPLLKYFGSRGIQTFCTARDFVETRGMLIKQGIDHSTFGKHGGRNKITKVQNLLKREFFLYRNVPDFDFCISSSFEAPAVSWLRRKPAIVFDDNEIAPNWLYAKFARFVISPSVIKMNEWKRNGINGDKVIPYKGFKEDIYIADYVPDEKFLENIPFRKFITLRPENIFAAYVPRNTSSIVPELVDALIGSGYKILYLPRYEIDKKYIRKSSNIYIPDKPLNGLDVCYYSDAVLTGAGTFSRESAILGTPAVSFYAGSKFLSVDKEMFSSGKIFYSRKPREILEYLIQNPKKNKNLDLARSKEVKKEVLCILNKIIF